MYYVNLYLRVVVTDVLKTTSKIDNYFLTKTKFTMSNHKKTKSVTVRFTQYDYETLKIRAEEDRTSISDYIRQNVKLEFIIL